MINRERKKFGIRAVRPKKLKIASPVSDCAFVDDGQIKGVCYIGFTDEFVEHVGKVMPEGAAPWNPVYISVELDKAKGDWAVSASYVLSERTEVLWRTTERPQWSTKVKQPRKDKRGLVNEASNA